MENINECKLAVEFANWILNRDSINGNFTITTIVDRTGSVRKEIS